MVRVYEHLGVELVYDWRKTLLYYPGRKRTLKFGKDILGFRGTSRFDTYHSYKYPACFHAAHENVPEGLREDVWEVEKLACLRRQGGKLDPLKRLSDGCSNRHEQRVGFNPTA